MAVELQSVGESPGASGTTDVVIVKPVGLTVGWLMAAQIVNAVSTVGTSTPPNENWLLIRNDDSASALRSEIYWKIADAADVAASDFTFVLSKAASCRGSITAWTGHDPTTPINASNGQGNAQSVIVTAPTITPSVANCMICLLCAVYNEKTSISSYAIANDNPASWLEAYDLASDLTIDIILSMGYAIRPETSATGNGTATIATAVGKYNIGQLIAIAPAVAAPIELSGKSSTSTRSDIVIQSRIPIPVLVASQSGGDIQLEWTY